ncbi:hypothetical protein CkaCkLH20_12752 [Colletotrichum karsti]|uniref:Uncharacterized protein n=1 Tax=Colletotrichum karsti TaxID=1095194 RepID=A0A9P6HT78_9PEZI|nr:uncharacterized protein CkaCkLH20_12752 [Colletotrichum karsti]KAF9869709.1 hypothetical protein CkaCkLH20_12752 [Colletotrichum karsti]
MKKELDETREMLVKFFESLSTRDRKENNDKPAADDHSEVGSQKKAAPSRLKCIPHNPKTQPVSADVLKFPMDPSPPHVPFTSKMIMRHDRSTPTKGTVTQQLRDDSRKHRGVSFAVSYSPSGSDKTADGDACIVLHNGTRPTDPALAMVPAETYLWKGCTEIASNLYIPNRPTDADPEGVARQDEFWHRPPKLFMDSSKKERWGHWFADCPGHQRRQWFTWLGTKVDGSGDLYGDDFTYQLALIRGEECYPRDPKVLDGAVAYARFNGMLARTRRFQIEFLDDSQVELGHQWAATAIITALRLWSLVTTPGGRLMRNRDSDF